MIARKRRLAIVATHPIQYQAVWFRALATEPTIEVDVFFCHRATREDQADAGFGVEFEWDVPLLEGYRHRFLQNVAAQPNVSTFAGMDTPEIRDFIRNGKYDAAMVLGWHHKSLWQAIRACWASHTPVMVRSDSHLHTPRSALKSAAKWLPYRWFISRLDVCMAVGTWSEQYFRHYGAWPERIVRVPHVVDPCLFEIPARALASQRGQIRRQWGLTDDVVVAVFVGKFSPWKRPMDFVEGIRQAARGGAPIAGLMVGDGELRPACGETVRASDLPVKFTGFLNQSQIVHAYVAADLLVLPSDGRETWGLVVNEAMACGLPCIVSDQVGCGPDLVVPGRNGDLFTFGNVSELADKLTWYSTRTEVLTAMAKIAYRRAQEYSPGAAVEAVLRAMDTVART
jgi:glycosyltransferase involved in cell wall biosynthesis